VILDIPVARVFLPLLEPARYKGAHGGRGSAKSHFYAELWLDESLRHKLDFVMLRETQKSLEFSVKKLLEQKIDRYNAGSYFEVQDKRIFSKKGGVTIFEGMQNHTADSIKSLEGFDRSWFEEAQNASDKSLTLLRPTIRKEGSEMWFSWNPSQPTDPIDVLLRGSQLPPGAVVVEANYTDNPWLPDELKQEMEYDRRVDYDKFAHVWLGGYQTHSEAQILRGKIAVEEFEPGTDWNGPYLGADWGFSVDPTALVKLWIKGRTLYVEYEAWGIGVEIDALPSLFDEVPGSRNYSIRGDNARPETISYLNRNGFRIASAYKGKGSVQEGIAHLRGYERIVVHPRCTHFQQEARMYRYKTDKLTGDILPEIVDSDNHLIDATRYALQPLIGGRDKKPEAEPAKAWNTGGSAGWMA
jgi:phage terminase large subunit